MFKKKDLIIFAAVLGLAFTGFLLIRLLFPDTGTKVEVGFDGQVVATFDIPASGRLETDLYAYTGRHCTMLFDNGTVSMLEAECPNQICVHHRPISREGECIVCLPNKITLTVRGGVSETDAVSQ